MKKRIMSLLLCIVMVLSVAPLYAYAVGGADGYVSINAEKETLAAGESTNVIFTVHATGDPLGAINFTVNLPAGLTYVSHEVLVSPSDYMMSGYDQTTGLFGCAVTAAGKNGTFDVLKLTVKAKDSLAGNNPIDITMGGMYKVDGSTEMDFGTSYSTTITISAVLTGTQNITGVTAPAKGATPVNTVTPPTGVLASINWYKDGDSSPFTGSTFEANTTYSAKITVKPDTGYAFADTIAFTVDGSSDGWTPAKQVDGSYILTKTFPATANQDTPSITTIPTASAITYGQTLGNSTLTGGVAEFSGSTVPGTFAWKTPSTAPTVADSDTTEYVVTFTPNDTSSYASTTCKVKLIVNPKDVTATQSIQNQNVVLYRGDFTRPELEDPSITVNEPTYSYDGAADYEAIKTKLSGLSKGQTGDISYSFTANGNYTGTITGTIHFTIVSLPPAGVTTPPAAKALTYNGAAQELVTAGTPEGGTMMYKLTGGTGWTSLIPKSTDAKTYTVYYMVRGDEDHSDFTPADNTVSVTISKKDAAVKPKSFTITKDDAIPTFELTYTGLVSGDTLTLSEDPAFTCYESDGITPVSASTPAGTYTITWTNESSTTFTGANNYHLTKTATATLTIKNKKPSGGSGSGSGSGGGSSLPIKPVDDAYSQPAGCVSDTIGEVNVSGAYQFRLTSTNGAAPVVTLSSTAFHGVFASQEGNDYFYKVYADGQPGQTCIVTVNGTTVARLTIASAGGGGVISDTTAPFTVPQGGAYQFRLTADAKPTMAAGSPSFTVAYVGNEGKDWFFKVYAVGQPGDGCGFYINGASVPVAVAHIS